MSRFISNNQSAAKLISELASFDGNSMSGVTFAPVTTARMPREWSRVYHSMRERIVYVVKSFNTPIAWYDVDGRWWFPRVTYSGYSSRHQTYARKGIHMHMDAMGRNWVDPLNIVNADEFCTYDEIMSGVKNSRSLPVARKESYVTVRGIKSGDYIQFGIDETGRYRPVYSVTSERGYANKRVYYALTYVEGKEYRAYIGESDERSSRLR